MRKTFSVLSNVNISNSSIINNVIFTWSLRLLVSFRLFHGTLLEKSFMKKVRYGLPKIFKDVEAES